MQLPLHTAGLLISWSSRDQYLPGSKELSCDDGGHRRGIQQLGVLAAITPRGAARGASYVRPIVTETTANRLMIRPESGHVERRLWSLSSDL